MALLLRCSRRANPRLLANLQYCPGCSRFDSSDSSGGRGAGDADGAGGGNPFEQPAPGSKPPTTPDGVGRGKKSSFAERMGLNIPAKPLPPVQGEEKPEASGPPPPSGDANARSEVASNEYPADDRKKSVGPRIAVAKPEIIEGLGSHRKVVQRQEKASPPPQRPKPDAGKDEGPEQVAQWPPQRQAVQEKVAQGVVRPHAEGVPPRVERVSTPPAKPHVEPPKKSTPLRVQTKTGGAPVAKVVVASDDFLDELSPRKRPPKVEPKKAAVASEDWLDELSPKKTKKSANEAWLEEFGPSTPKRTVAKPAPQEKPAIDPPPLPTKTAAEVQQASEPAPEPAEQMPPVQQVAPIAEIPVAAAEAGPLQPEPEMTPDVAEQLATTGEEVAEAVEGGLVMGADEMQPDIAEVLPSGEGDALADVSPPQDGSKPATSKSAEEEQQISKEELGPPPEDTTSQGHSVFDAFLRKAASEDQPVGPTPHPSEIRGDAPPAQPDGQGLSVLLNFGQTQEAPPLTPPGQFSQPPPPPPPPPPQSGFQGGSAQPGSPSRGSLMDRLGWGRDEGPPSPYQQPPSPTQSPFSPFSPQQGPGQQGPLKSKLAERLGWTGDASELQEEDRSRGRRKQPRRKPSAAQEMYGRPRGPRQTQEDRHAKAFRSAKAMEMALEGRLDEFDPDTYVDPDEVSGEERERYDEMEEEDGSSRRRRRGRDLEIRESEIPKTAWEGAPMNMADYYVPDAYTQIGEHPSQHKVMDIERELNLELDPQYMVNFSQPVPWTELRRTTTPRQYLMRHKDDIMEQLRLSGVDATEQDFMDAAQIGIRDYRPWKRWMDSGKKFLGESLHGNVKLEEEFIRHLVDSKVAKDHPMYSHLCQSAHALEHNPTWSFAKKAQFMTRMVNNALKELP